MLWPLLIMALGATLLFLTLHLMAVRNEILRRRLRRLSIQAAAESQGQAMPSLGRGAA
jgi:heme exporter protein C